MRKMKKTVVAALFICLVTCLCFGGIAHADNNFFSFAITLQANPSSCLVDGKQSSVEGSSVNLTISGCYSNGVVTDCNYEALPSLEEVGAYVENGYLLESWGGYPVGMSITNVVSNHMASNPDFVYDPYFYLIARYATNPNAGQGVNVIISFDDYTGVSTPRPISVVIGNERDSEVYIPSYLTVGQVVDLVGNYWQFKYWTCNGQTFYSGDNISEFCKNVAKSGSGSQANLVMTAVWNPVYPCTVTYDYNDGSGRTIVQNVYVSNAGYINLTLPSIEHKSDSVKFLGWYRVGYGDPVSESWCCGKSCSEIKLTAKWEQTDYVFTYSDDVHNKYFSWSPVSQPVTAIVIPNFNINISEPQERLANGTLTWVQFAGFKCVQNGKMYPLGTKYIDIANELGNVSSVDIVVDYREILRGTLVLDYNYGKLNADETSQKLSISINKETHSWLIDLPTPPTPGEGYKFTGWKNYAGVSFNSNFVYYGTEMTLYAQWEKTEYRLVVRETINTGDISVCTFQPDDMNVTIPMNSAPNKSGTTTYKFMGWSYSSQPKASLNGVDVPGGTTMKAQNLIEHANGDTVRLYAVWSLDPTVKLHIRNKTTNEVTYNKTIQTIGGYIPADTYIPVSAGYSLTWYKDTSYTTEVSIAGKFTEDTAVYGLEKELQYKVAYHFGHPTRGAMGITRSEPRSYASVFTAWSPTWSCTGYTFKGWGRESTSSVTYTAGQKLEKLVNPSVQDTVNLYSIWEPNKYTIVLNGNGGEGSVENFEAQYDTPVTLPSGGFTKTGYRFLGWSTSVSATTAQYSGGSTVKNLTQQNNKNGTPVVTLYAVWQAIEYKVVLLSNGGNGSMETIVAKKDDTFKLPIATFTKAGYSFTGWNTSPTGKGKSMAPGMYKAGSGTLILYAQWSTSKSFNILIDYNS